MSDLEQILNGEQPQGDAPQTPEVTPEATPEAPEAVEAATPEPAPVTEPEPAKADAPEMVPVSVVSDLRAQLRELKLQQQQQPPAPQPKPPEFIDPEGMGYMQQQVQGMAQEVKLNFSEEMTRQQHGDETVDAALAAFKAQAGTNPALHQAILAERSPWGAMVKWHQQQQVAQEVGNDPAAYREKLEKEIRAKIEAELVTKQAQEKAAQAAPSMANVTGTGGGPKATAWGGPTPLDKVIGS
ncbi:hypothetical protein [Phaeobacter sp. JH204B]|uniref:hypothetical protein n=1 Tax=Phaeobacter sp. JH204B TaxID=3112503 RepID=UPI003A8A0204